MRAVIVYNPMAGTLQTERQVAWAAAALHDRGWVVSVRPTQRPGQMHTLAAASVEEGVDAIFAAGGDGTVGAVAGAAAGSGSILGVLPIGTANIWASELGLAGPMSTASAVHACVEAQLGGAVRAVDMGQGNGRKFLLWAGVGLDAHIVKKIEPRPGWGKRFGALYYYAAGIRAGFDFRGVPMTIRTEQGSASGVNLLVVVANVRRYAGNDRILDPEARVDDGLLEVWWMAGESFWDGLAHLIRYRLGRHREHPQVHKLRGPAAEIELERPMLLQCDGELSGMFTRMHFQVCPGDLRVFVPRHEGSDIFIGREKENANGDPRQTDSEDSI